MRTTTYHLGLIGYPLGHSYSPQLHHAALSYCGLIGEYRLFPIEPTEAGRQEIGLLVDRVRSGDLQGLNVTIPHKQTVMQFLDTVSPVAQAVGAVNTLYVDSLGRMAGENTDVPGFLRDAQRLVGSEPGKAVVLGAGGSARAAVYALSRAGWRVLVLARRRAQAAALVLEIGLSLPSHGPLAAEEMNHDACSAAVDCDLLVNTTPVGMSPNVAGCPWPEGVPLPPRAAVYDLIYNPSETQLIKRAKRQGLPAANGAGMLVTQGALAFALWTGMQPPFEVMERAFYQ